jgi:multiple sugar transport system substrate-binding protein
MLRGAFGFAVIGMTALAAACAPAANPTPAAPTTAPANATAPTAAPTKAVEQAASPSPKGTVVWLSRIYAKENDWETEELNAWKKLNNGIQIDHVVTADYDKKRLAMQAAGQELTIYAAYSFGNDYLHGLLHDLTDALKRDNYDWSDIDTSVNQAYVVKGRYFGMPALAIPSMFTYNIDLYKKAGVPEPPKTWNDPSWTWDEMISRTKAVTHITDDPRTSVYGTWMPTGLDDESRIYRGSDYGGPGDPYGPEWWANVIYEKTGFDSPEYLQYLDFIQTLYREKIFPPREVWTSLSKLGYPFLTGRIAGEIHGHEWFLYQQIQTSFKWGVASIPHLPGQKAKSVLFVDNFVISANTKVFDAAWEFLKFITGRDSQKDYMLITGILVPRRSLWDIWIDNTGYSNHNELKQLMTDAFANGWDSGSHHLGAYPQMDTIYSQEMDPIWNLKTAPKDLMPRVNQLIEAKVKEVIADVKKTAG